MFTKQQSLEASHGLRVALAHANCAFWLPDNREDLSYWEKYHCEKTLVGLRKAALALGFKLTPILSLADKEKIEPPFPEDTRASIPKSSGPESDNTLGMKAADVEG